MPGFKIVILLSLAHFQVLLPDHAASPAETFESSPAGAASFVEWLQPYRPVLSQGDDPPVLCMVGAERLEGMPEVARLILGSEPPFRSLEPFSASIQLITPFEQGNGVSHRTMPEAVRMCRGEQSP
jgi:hypothetical protein